MACKICPSQLISNQVFEAAKELKRQRAVEWGKKNGLLLVGFYEDYDEEDKETTWRFAADNDPILTDKKVEYLWCS